MCAKKKPYFVGGKKVKELLRSALGEIDKTRASWWAWMCLADPFRVAYAARVFVCACVCVCVSAAQRRAELKTTKIVALGKRMCV